MLVHVRAAALNPIDYKLPSIPVMSWTLGSRPVSQDMAGTVQASRSPLFKAGDAVYGHATGAMAERVVANDTDIAPKPAGMTFVQAASWPTAALTSLQSLLAANVGANSKVIVAGASGGCGLTGIQIARALVGPGGIVAGICGPRNLEFVRAKGSCTHVLDYTQPDSILSAESPLRQHVPFDAVYDTVTSPEGSDSMAGQTYDAALRYVYSLPLSVYVCMYACMYDGVVAIVLTRRCF